MVFAEQIEDRRWSEDAERDHQNEMEDERFGEEVEIKNLEDTMEEASKQ